MVALGVGGTADGVGGMTVGVGGMGVGVGVGGMFVGVGGMRVGVALFLCSRVAIGLSALVVDTVVDDGAVIEEVVGVAGRPMLPHAVAINTKISAPANRAIWRMTFLYPAIHPLMIAIGSQSP